MLRLAMGMALVMAARLVHGVRGVTAAPPSPLIRFAPLRRAGVPAHLVGQRAGQSRAAVLGVGAAWEMTRLSNSPTMVALVQSAMMLPMMLASVPAGAMADMFDRRKVAISGLAISILSAAALTALAMCGAGDAVAAAGILLC